MLGTPGDHVVGELGHIRRDMAAQHVHRAQPGDVGKVIGRKGSTIQAIRSLVQVAAAKAGRRCSLDLVED